MQQPKQTHEVLPDGLLGRTFAQPHQERLRLAQLAADGVHMGHKFERQTSPMKELVCARPGPESEHFAETLAAALSQLRAAHPHQRRPKNSKRKSNTHSMRLLSVSIFVSAGCLSTTSTR